MEKVMSDSERDRLYKIRHSAAHVMAQAVLERYPDAKLATGPPIDDGFYYDFHLGVEIGAASVAGFDQDSPGAFGGVLRGVAAGDTDITFSLVHGEVGTGHADFKTEPLAVHVR